MSQEIMASETNTKTTEITPLKNENTNIDFSELLSIIIIIFKPNRTQGNVFSKSES